MVTLEHEAISVPAGDLENPFFDFILNAKVKPYDPRSQEKKQQQALCKDQTE